MTRQLLHSYLNKFSELRKCFEEVIEDVSEDCERKIYELAMGFDYTEEKIFYEHGLEMRREKYIKYSKPNLVALMNILKSNDRDKYDWYKTHLIRIKKEQMELMKEDIDNNDGNNLITIINDVNITEHEEEPSKIDNNED